MPFEYHAVTASTSSVDWDTIAPPLTLPSGAQYNQPRTQKAKGLTCMSDIPNLPKLQIQGLIQDIKEVDALSEFPYFARPCPVTPRHGFVDSRVVANKDELRQVVEETFAVEPDGEVMLTKPYEPDFNIVWTPSLITFGKGNDGATAGNDTITLPAVRNIPWQLGLSHLEIAPGDDPYVEIISGLDSIGALLTQVRSGPKGSTVGDYIPRKTTVQMVVRATGDLLAWESLMQRYKHQGGLVIHNPKGSPTDHYSVHARTMELPVVYGDECPKVGDILEPIKEESPNYDAVLNGYAVGARIKLTKQNRGAAARVMIYSLHHSSVLTGEHAFWIGVGIALFLRLGMLALRAEARHFHTSKDNNDRNFIYTRSQKMSLSRLRSGLPKLLTLFTFGKWDSSMGGKAWARCGVATKNIFNAWRHFARRPREKSFKLLMAAFNIGINQAHNNGWWMNKFVSEEVFARVQYNTPELWPPVANFLYKVRDAHEALTADQFDEEISAAREWPVTHFHPSPWKSVRIRPDHSLSYTITHEVPSASPHAQLGHNYGSHFNAEFIGNYIPLEGETCINRQGHLLLRVGGEIVHRSETVYPGA